MCVAGPLSAWTCGSGLAGLCPPASAGSSIVTWDILSLGEVWTWHAWLCCSQKSDLPSRATFIENLRHFCKGRHSKDVLVAATLEACVSADCMGSFPLMGCTCTIFTLSSCLERFKPFWCLESGLVLLKLDSKAMAELALAYICMLYALRKVEVSEMPVDSRARGCTELAS